MMQALTVSGRETGMCGHLRVSQSDYMHAIPDMMSEVMMLIIVMVVAVLVFGSGAACARWMHWPNWCLQHDEES